MANDKPKTIHRRQLFDGRETAEQVHWGAFPGAKCACGLPPAIRCVTFAPIGDLLEQDPLRAQAMAQANGGQLPMVRFTYGVFVKIGEMFACSLCKATLEKVAARLPSWVLVEWDRGPGPDSPIVQVG
jgi:hypothetical protein